MRTLFDLGELRLSRSAPTELLQKIAAWTDSGTVEQVSTAFKPRALSSTIEGCPTIPS